MNISVGMMIPNPCTDRMMTIITATTNIVEAEVSMPGIKARFIPDVIATVARAGIRNNIKSASLITCVLAGWSRPFSFLPITMPIEINPRPRSSRQDMKIGSGLQISMS